MFRDIARLLPRRRQFGPEVAFGNCVDGGDAFGLPHQERTQSVDDGTPAHHGTDPFCGGLVTQIGERAEEDVRYLRGHDYRVGVRYPAVND